MARKRGAELGAALTECFPERLFLLVYRDEQVSFCQFTEELSLGISRGSRRIVDLQVPPGSGDACFCEVGEQRVPYVVRSQQDAEFPHAQFADCALCGNEVILWADQEVVLASESAPTQFPDACVPIDVWERTSSGVRSPTTFAELKAAVQARLHPGPEWWQSAARLWLGREPGDWEDDPSRVARVLLQSEELTALLLAYRIRQLSLPPEEQNRTILTPQRLGIPRHNLLYHPARRVLAPVTVATGIQGTTTSHTLLNSTDTRYEAGRRLDPHHAIYEGLFAYGYRTLGAEPYGDTLPSGETVRVVCDIAFHASPPWACRPYGVAQSLKRMREQGTERCVAFTALYDEEEHVIAQHRRLFRRFHELDMDPDPTITLDLSDGILTLRADVFVWGVFLGWNNNDNLPDNTFDLLPGIPYSIPWDETVSGPPKVWRTGNRLFLE